MKTFAALVLACLFAGTALAQERPRPPQKAAMKQEERQRMREDMRDAYKGGARPERQRPMSPQQRDRLRRDVQDASKEMKR
jgi:hypothetical protein